MAMDPVTGNVKAYVGGIDFTSFKYDHVTQSKRQAGSTFKPFLYILAMQEGMSPCDRSTQYFTNFCFERYHLIPLKAAAVKKISIR